MIVLKKEPKPRMSWAKLIGVVWLTMLIPGNAKGQENPLPLTAQHTQSVFEVEECLMEEENRRIADTLHNRGALYSLEGNYENAEFCLNKALEIYRNLSNEEHPNIVRILNSIGLNYAKKGLYQEAKKYLQEALTLGEKNPGLRLEQAQTRNNLGLLYVEQESYQEAKIFFLEALDISQDILPSEHIFILSIYNSLASVYTYLEDYPEANNYFEKALAIQELSRANKIDVAKMLNNFAVLQLKKSRYQEAKSYFIQALDIYNQVLGINKHPDTITIIYNLGVIHQEEGLYREAEYNYLTALNRGKELLEKEHTQNIKTLNSLAQLYLELGQYDLAKKYFESALKITDNNFQTEEKLSLKASLLGGMGSLYLSQGNYKEAESLNLRALKIKKEFWKKDHSEIALNLNNLAVLKQEQGLDKKAQLLFQESLEMRKRLLPPNHPDIAQSIKNLAVTYSAQNNYKEAELLFKKALEIEENIWEKQHPRIATTLSSLGLLFLDIERYEEAELYLEKSLEIRQNYLGENHLDIANSFNNLAALYERQGRYEEAEEYYGKALKINKSLLGDGIHPNIAINLSNLATFSWQRGSGTEALPFLEEAIKVQEKNLKVNLFVGFERQRRDFLRKFFGDENLAISLHLNELNNDSRASRLAMQTILERKGRILDIVTNNQEILRNHANDQETKKLLTDLFKEYEALSNLLYYPPRDANDYQVSTDNYQIRIQEREAKIQELERELSSRSETFQTQIQPITLETVQQLISADAALVEMVKYRPYEARTNTFGELRYGAYILHAQGEPIGIDLGEAKKIEKALNYFRSTLSYLEDDDELVKESARNLDMLLVEPLREHLGDTSQILLSPDDALNLIPFEALVDKEGKYLLQTYSFTYLTSGRDLLRLQNKFSAQKSAVIMADPDYENSDDPLSTSALVNDSDESSITRTRVRSDSGNAFSLDIRIKDISPLGNTKGEAEEVSQLLKEAKFGNVRSFIDNQATESVLKQTKSPSILHIATHGIFSSSEGSNLEEVTFENNPLLLSGLAFAGVKQEKGSRSEDGLVTALETTTLDLRGTKVVVLSACDTGLGSIQSREGFYSLRRALVIAGSESQVISLWKVSDKATKKLMVNYYRRLLAGEGRTEALQKAKLEMLQSDNYFHPFYWAAFIPSGDWTPAWVESSSTAYSPVNKSNY